MGPGAAERGFEVVRRVHLPVDPGAAWARVTTADGVADELRPLLRMTVPRGLRDGLAGVRPGEPAGRAWLLLGGVLPVECDDLVVVGIGERWFTERSSLVSLRTWEHRREVLADPGGGCVVVDRLRGTPRRALGLVPGSVRLARGLVTALFAHRHRRLLRWARSGTPG
ncbi:hypothetical protein [Nocardioides sp. CFH 31398]|uniref:hypothetical protein n=1 Tax=Nocardioides sp. CFH 31398 TaxID=2919579 RepID=UPI001F0542BB|nr:hypothetical protein [Nocardioides sp. CFH 31398]MCH1868208.1 hypothetical protein [Nocardioides sp. CFH 31398]